MEIYKDVGNFQEVKLSLEKIIKQLYLVEIQEELDVQITVGDFLTTVEYDYPNFHLIMHAYQCELLGEFHLQEHSAARWLNLETLYDVDWLEADLPIVEYVKSLIA